ncbi:MAG: TrkH family potassium uptake protein [Lachnospiraceae bacterium]|nr:TrkH family potassium uptake protein [Lachnospiraceae bacterium]
MNYKAMLRVHSWILFIEASFMVPALIISLVTKDRPAVTGFAAASVIAVAVGFLMRVLSKGGRTRFYAREGLVITGMAWIVLSLVGALPFYISGRIPNYVDAFFEIVSGFTTTGASVLSDVEALGKGLLYWRSFSHWVGGMGVLVFFLAIVPASGKNDGYMLHILRAESPGPSVNKMVPRMRDTAAILYKMYLALTGLDIICLCIARMPVYDAFCIAFGTAGTGGFCVLNSGMANYTPAAQYVTTVFMLLFGVNFGIYYLLVLRQFKTFFSDEELRLYFFIVALAILGIAVNIFGKTASTEGVEATFRHASFQVASIITTTGYSTVDFDIWPGFSKAILLVLMFVGASAGSTGGGIKVSRVLLLIRNLGRNIHQIFHPNEVRVVRMNRQKVPEQTLANVGGYLAAYVMIVIVSFLIVAADGVNASLTTDFSAVMATFNNIGPGFDSVGPAQNFGLFSNFTKIILSMDMLLGRLEIFPILAIFAPGTYRKN